MKFPDTDQKSFISSLASGNESWGGGRDPSESPRKSLLLSPWIGRCRIEVDVLRSWSPPRGLIRPSAAGKNKFSSFWEKYYFLSHWVFSSRFPMRPSFPTPQCLQPISHPSKFPPRTKRFQGTIQVRLSFQIDGFLTGLSQKQGNTEPNGMIGRLKGSPKRLSHWVFPSDKRSCMFRR